MGNLKSHIYGTFLKLRKQSASSLGWSCWVGEEEAVISGLKKEALNTLLFSTENSGRRAQAQRDHMEAKEPWLRQLTLVKKSVCAAFIWGQLGTKW